MKINIIEHGKNVVKNVVKNVLKNVVNKKSLFIN